MHVIGRLSDGIKNSRLDCVCYADKTHLYWCRFSDFVRLEEGLGLILVLILSNSSEYLIKMVVCIMVMQRPGVILLFKKRMCLNK